MRKNIKNLKEVEGLLKVRGLEQVEIEEKNGITNILASDPESGKKFLVRVISKSRLTSDSVSVGQIQKMKKALEEKKVDKGILIGKSFTPSAKKAVEKSGIEFIKLESLMTFDIFSHKYVPKHEVTSKEEAEDVLKRLRVKPYQLPYIKASDPAVKAIGGKPGDIIKITRKSPTAGYAIYYRYVIN
jgi:DNA-directed RNA polymerase subunit H